MGLTPAVMAQTSYTTAVIKLHAWVFVGAALFSLVTVFLSCNKPGRIAAKVSPVEAVRYTEADCGRKKAKAAKKPASLGRMAWANVGRNRKKTVLVVISLSLAVVLLNLTVMFANGFDMDLYLKHFCVSDFVFANADYFNVQKGFHSSDEAVEDSAMQTVLAQNGVKESGCVYGQTTRVLEKIKKNRLVFKNREMMDCTDNPEAFYEYLISSGYNKKYEIIWLVSEKRKFRNQNTGNVKFVTAENKYGWSSPLAYYYGATAGFFFYSHNSAGLNRYRCKGQTVVNLWHGCGYKDAEQGKKKQNIKPDFDYALVPGPVFVKTKSGLWNCEPDRLLMMGYPRYDWMLHPSMSKDEILDSLFGWKGKKAVLWMPTFRKSDLGGCAENEIELPCQLPAIQDMNELKELDSYLREQEIILIIKKHPLQTEWDENEQEFTNIRYVAEALLEKKQIKLYELIGISDGLLSDYSSVAVDYLLLDRPLGYVLADYNIYKEKRGFVFEDPLEYMPGEKIYNACDIRKFMKHLTDGTDSYRQERAKNLKQMHNKTENYCKRLADYLQL